MNKTETLFEVVEGVVEQLRKLEGSNRKLYPLRRKLQEAQNDFIKQGERVKITKEFELHCIECGEKQLREEDYYLHLRQQHQYSDEDAASEANEPLRNYELGIQDLKKGLREFTDTLLEDTIHG